MNSFPWASLGTSLSPSCLCRQTHLIGVSQFVRFFMFILLYLLIFISSIIHLFISFSSWMNAISLRRDQFFFSTYM